MYNLAITLWRGQPVAGLPPLMDSLRISLFIGLNVAAILCFAVLVLYWIAATVHPVQTNPEIYHLLGRLVRFIFGTRSPLVTIREGELLGGTELKSGGVALVDLNSALVIEKQRDRRSHKKTAVEEQSTTGGLIPPMASVSGPGLVFLRHGEKLRGVVSLRKQFRMLQNTLGQTSDGIEVRTVVFTIFTLGQPANVIQVTYIGDPFPENLRVVQMDAKTHKVKAIRDELDNQDKEEIHNFAQSFIYYVEPNSPLALGDKVRDYPPYLLDDQRILSAVYSRARNVSDGQPDSSWSDLPVMVAAEIFRRLISRYTYDSLYLPEDPATFPLQNEVKPRFSAPGSLYGCHVLPIHPASKRRSAGSRPACRPPAVPHLWGAGFAGLEDIARPGDQDCPCWFFRAGSHRSSSETTTPGILASPLATAGRPDPRRSGPGSDAPA